MKKILIISSLCAYTLLFTGTAFAITDSTTVTDDATIQVKLEEKARVLAEQKAYEAKKLEEKARIKAESLAAEVKKLEEKMVYLTAEFSRLQAKGVSTAEVQATIAKYQQKLEDARAQIANMTVSATPVKTMTDEAKRKMETATLEAKQKVEAARADAEARIKAAREAASTTKEKVRSEVAELRADLKEDVLRKFGRQFDEVRVGILYRYEWATKSLNNLITRIESRVAKLKEAEKDTATVEVKIAPAKEAIMKAESDIAQLSELLKQDIKSFSDDARKEALEKVRAQAKVAKESLKAAHEAVRNIIKELLTIK